LGTSAKSRALGPSLRMDNEIDYRSRDSPYMVISPCKENHVTDNQFHCPYDKFEIEIDSLCEEKVREWSRVAHC
jgi:hypothetical protein